MYRANAKRPHRTTARYSSPCDGYDAVPLMTSITPRRTLISAASWQSTLADAERRTLRGIARRPAHVAGCSPETHDTTLKLLSTWGVGSTQKQLRSRFLTSTILPSLDQPTKSMHWERSVATIADVARKAGVSNSTAWNVLNGTQRMVSSNSARHLMLRLRRSAIASMSWQAAGADCGCQKASRSSASTISGGPTASSRP